MENQENLQSPELTTVQDKKSDGIKITTPGAIIIAGILVAVGIMFSSGGGNFAKNFSNDKQIEVKDIGDLTMRKINPVDANEHILGDISKAKIAIVEFSDFECPFCKQLHPVMKQALDFYKEDVVLVYRHFPLESIHPNARPTAHASECVNEIVGNDGFWKFVDGIFTSQDASVFTEIGLQNVAENSGADLELFKACQTSGKYNDLIDSHITDATNSGARGTPDLTVINLKTKEAVHVGADPSQLGQVIDQMLK